MSDYPPVLDPCCGSRMWWFDHKDTRTVFGDRRRETLTVKDTSHGHDDGQRVLRIDPDIDLDFRAMSFPNDTFHLVAFDPPHLVRAGAKSWMAAKYGKLGLDWREDLRAGFRECFRVLRPLGVLVFKWNETQVKIREVLALTDVAPLFGNTSGRNAGTHWIVFMKPTPSPARECGTCGTAKNGLTVAECNDCLPSYKNWTPKGGGNERDLHMHKAERRP